jgi:hypothetical protein
LDTKVLKKVGDYYNWGFFGYAGDSTTDGFLLFFLAPLEVILFADMQQLNSC